jgi:TonB-dependent receptor
VRSGSVLTPITVNQSYTDLFPSLNMRFEASDDVVLRLAAQRGIARPAYGAIRVGAAINDTASPGTIGGGNPNLLPEYTWGVDASVEYYLPANGVLAVTVFHRWVDNVFFQGAALVSDDTYNTGGIDRTGYLLSGTFNGENGRLYGIEFNVQNQFDFLPSPFDGFGVQGNLTLLGGEYDAPATATSPAQTGLAFQGLSDTIANASLFFEKYGISARISYQWRSDWEDTIGGLGAGESRQGYENLDVSLRYALNENLTLFADLANLTDEYYIAYTGGRDMPSEVEQIGSRFLFGVRFDF